MDKRFLGKDLDVICFLMSVEIERLYHENHDLKLRIDTKDNLNIDK